MTRHLTPETAYAEAPSIIREITWVAAAQFDRCDATTAGPDLSYRPYVRREYRVWITATNAL
jgi:hypothetical protein